MPVLPQLPTLWVSAAPFRYPVHHLMTATGVPWQVMAVVADLPQQQVRSLLYGRDGRRRSRLSPYAAVEQAPYLLLRQLGDDGHDLPRHARGGHQVVYVVAEWGGRHPQGCLLYTSDA